jgi:hypothetical protein
MIISLPVRLVCYSARSSDVRSNGGHKKLGVKFVEIKGHRGAEYDDDRQKTFKELPIQLLLSKRFGSFSCDLLRATLLESMSRAGHPFPSKN